MLSSSPHGLRNKVRKNSKTFSVSVAIARSIGSVPVSQENLDLPCIQGRENFKVKIIASQAQLDAYNISVD